MKDITNANCVVRGKVRVSFDRLGEGNCGDFDPSDPEDTELLRFDVERRSQGAWEPIPDASYCCQIPADASDDIKTRALLHIMAAVQAHVADDHAVKKVCERLSWLDEEMVSAQAPLPLAC